LGKKKETDIFRELFTLRICAVGQEISCFEIYRLYWPDIQTTYQVPSK